ncbi:3-methyladenine DNA glycosylase AlkD [Paenibacillus anaericanus]|uniref:DNA alkylation repair protein n=1 Tax=Paenibacillus anaericanus TaxID=170367 RepID=UPI002785BF42|nr:DNA alkylation repair protein [Paenibacillus anaericanus]MDQ0089933.1 3-methyladenine DNA glycosylase AlkD [Paenibacillus anaericanus]
MNNLPTKIEMNIIQEVQNRLGNASKQSGLTTGRVRSISSSLFSTLEDRSLNTVLNYCEQLLAERKWELGVIAYDWAYKVRKLYREDTFYIFERWLKEYVSGWGDCDDFCTHAFGELLGQYPHLLLKVMDWTHYSDFWVRRASAVILIYPIKKGMLKGMDPYIISDRLMDDSHDLVQKGYGWMLKILSRAKPEEVFHYLLKNKSQMPRVAFRYALEKLTPAQRAVLMEK